MSNPDRLERLRAVTSLAAARVENDRAEWRVAGLTRAISRQRVADQAYAAACDAFEQPDAADAFPSLLELLRAVKAWNDVAQPLSKARHAALDSMASFDAQLKADTEAKAKVTQTVDIEVKTVAYDFGAGDRTAMVVGGRQMGKTYLQQQMREIYTALSTGQIGAREAAEAVRAVSQRGSGRTTKQMREAPCGALFVWCNEGIEQAQRLRSACDRQDIFVTTPGRLMRLHHCRYTAVVVDHACNLTMQQRRLVELLRRNYRPVTEVLHPSNPALQHPKRSYRAGDTVTFIDKAVMRSYRELQHAADNDMLVKFKVVRVRKNGRSLDLDAIGHAIGRVYRAPVTALLEMSGLEHKTSP